MVLNYRHDDILHHLKIFVFTKKTVISLQSFSSAVFQSFCFFLQYYFFQCFFFFVFSSTLPRFCIYLALPMSEYERAIMIFKYISPPERIIQLTIWDIFQSFRSHNSHSNILLMNEQFFT